jgi:hypothetical protein
MNDHVDKNAEDMGEKETNLEKVASDIDKIRELVQRLELRGSAEGADRIEQSVEGAGRATEEAFDREDQELEERQEQSETYRGELDGKATATESDLGKLSDASAQIETQEATREFAEAKAAALEDIDALEKLVDRARESREKSEQVQEQHRRVRGRG